MSHQKAEYFINKAAELRKKREVDRAVEQLEMGASVDKQSWQVCFELGMLLGQLERYDEAAKSFREALARGSDKLSTWWELGNVLKAAGRYDSAEEAYLKAAETSQRHGGLWFSLADLYLRLMNRPNDALECCDKAIRCDPRDEQAYCLKAEALQRLGKRGEAMRALESAVEANPSFTEAKKMLDRMGQALRNQLEKLAEFGPFSNVGKKSKRKR